MSHNRPVQAAKLLLPLLLATSCATAEESRILEPVSMASIQPGAASTIDRFVANEMERRHIAGMAIAILKDGKIRYANGYGFADIERKVPVRSDTAFLVASITKMFTAVGTMLLVQEGKVRLDAPVGDYVKGLPHHWRSATIRQLLGHTSGINSFTNHNTPPCGRRVEEKDYKQQDVIAEVSCLPLDFQPGSNWSYSDSGYFTLGLLIEHVSGQPYVDFLRQKIFKPLGLETMRLMGPIGTEDGRAVGYRWDEGRLTRAPLLSPVIEGPGGGLVGTVYDLAKFDAALSDDRLLPQPVLHEMWKPLGLGSAMYGLGFGVRPIKGMPQVGHTGGGPGTATSFARFVDHGVTVVVLTNTAQPPASIQEIVGGIAERVLQPVQTER